MRTRRLDVEVWFDFICPWCLIGKRHLESALRSVEAAHREVAFDLRWHARPLLPDTPPDGVPFVEFYRRRLGSADAVAARQIENNTFKAHIGEIGRLNHRLAQHGKLNGGLG